MKYYLYNQKFKPRNAMKRSLYLTTIITILFISLPINIISQTDEMASPTEPVTYLRVRKSKDLSSFTLEVIDDDDFKYREFLEKSKSSDDTYTIGKEKYSRKELTKLLRKGGRKSKTIKEFINFLTKENYSLSKELELFELELLYSKFREGTLDKYLNELPSVYSY